MKSIIMPTSLLQKISEEQQYDKSTEYRVSSYLVDVKCDDGILLYNTLSGELLLLSCTEYDNIFDENIKEELVKKWYLVPKDFCENEFINQLKTVANLMAIKKTGLKDFVIYPTTDCNARCFYCFELTGKHIHMSEQTAAEVADFIIKNKTDGTIKLNWFGGEPLYNSSAIDIICTRLKNAGVEYKGDMVSNGYLLTPENIEKAKNLWKLDNIQITLDGTEEVYNRTKAYIYKDTNPYKIVLQNLQNAIDAGIFINIRLNMDKNNAENLFELTNELCKRFKGKKNLYIYVVLLHPHTKAVKVFEDDYEAFEMYKKINEIIKSNNLSPRFLLEKKYKVSYCMADSDRTVTILPNGEIGKCENYIDKYFVGNIKDGITDTALIDYFKEPIDKTDDCIGCNMYPLCVKIKNCPNIMNVCTRIDRMIELDRLKEKILNSYKKHKK